MAKVSVTDFKAGIDRAETEATRHATEVADEEHQIQHQHLEASDSSVGLNRQRQRDDPASGRGKAK